MTFYSIPRASCIGETLLDGSAADTNDGTLATYTLTNGSYASTQVGYQKQHAVFGATTSFTRASLAGIQTLAVAVYPTAATKTLFTYVTTTGLVTFDGSYVVSTSGLTNATIYVNNTTGTTLTANAWNLLIITHDAATATNFNLGSSSFLGNACMLRTFNTKLTERERLALWHEFNRKLGGGSDFGAYVPAPKYSGLNPALEDSSNLVPTLLGSPTDTSDMFGITTAKNLNGTNQGYAYTSSVSLTSGQSLTCMLMVNGDNAPATTGTSTYEYAQAMCSGVPNGAGVWGFSWNSPDANYVGSAYIATGTATYAAKFGTISGGQWYCLALKWDSSTNKIRSYKDGVFQNETSTVGSINASSNIRFSLNDQGYFPGKIGQWAIWDSSLSDDQISFATFAMRSGKYPYAFRRSIPSSLAPFLVIHIPGDTANNLNFADISGNSNNATSSSASLKSKAQQNTCVSLSGTDSQKATITSNAGNSLTALTICGWFKRDSSQAQQYGVLARKDTSSGQRYLYGFQCNNSSGEIIVADYYDGSTSKQVTTTWVNGEWVFATETISVADGQKGYKNARLVGSNAISTLVAPTTGWCIGGDPIATNQQFKGQWSNFMVFNKVLNSSEIQSLYYATYRN